MLPQSFKNTCPQNKSMWIKYYVLIYWKKPRKSSAIDNEIDFEPYSDPLKIGDILYSMQFNFFSV